MWRNPSGVSAKIRCDAILTCCAVLSCAGFGCKQEGVINVRLEQDATRFVIDHEGWPRPFWTPRVTEFAIASEEDGPIWQLESIDLLGLAAKRLTIEYGRIPAGFAQIYPEGGLRPTILKPGRNYFVAAGGSRVIYRMVFALPVSDLSQILPTVPQKPRESAEPDPATPQPRQP